MMSFQAFTITIQILLVLLIGFVSSVVGVYEQNPFLQNVSANTPLPPSTQGPEIQPSLSTSTESPSITTMKPSALPTTEASGLLNGNALSSKCLQPRGQFPSSSCNNYVNCWGGIAIEQTCPGGLLFNPIKLYCDYAQNVDCLGKPIAAATTPSPPVTVPSYVTSSSTVQVGSSPAAPVINPALRKFCLTPTGLFRGSSCGKFVNCWGDFAVEQDCPEGLHFSTEGYCDYPEKAGCGSQALKVEEKSKDCPLEFGNFRNRSNCGQFYTCAFYKVAAKYNCPEGFSFSDVIGVCDYSHRVDCSKEPQIYQKTAINNFQGNYLSSNSFAHPDLAKPAEVGDARCTVSQGLVRDRNNCSMYYVCDLGTVVATYVCPKGYKFSIELGVCDHEDKVTCNNPSLLYKAGSTQNAPKGNLLSSNAFIHPDLVRPAETGDKRCLVSYGLARDRYNCSMFYACELGNVVATYVCPMGYKFNTKLGMCDHEQRVICDNQSEVDHRDAGSLIIPNIPQEMLYQVQNCVPGSVFRLNPQCTSACNCRSGVAEIIQCPSGLAYDSQLDKCVAVHLARC